MRLRDAENSCEFESQRIPFELFIMSSDALFFAPTTGVPQESASIAASPWVSKSEGNANACALL